MDDGEWRMMDDGRWMMPKFEIRSSAEVCFVCGCHDEESS